LGDSEANDCIPKYYDQNRIVCVCNSTYCDNFPTTETLKQYQAIHFVSTKCGKRFYREFRNFSTVRKRSASVIKVNPQQKQQSIIGFGGAFTDAVGINILALSPGAQENLLRSYFGADGIQYSIARVPIASTDFSTHVYSYDDFPGDFDLKNFSLTAINLTDNNLKLLASPWSAPGWMKESGKMEGGTGLIGGINSSYHVTWANYYIKFLEEYAKNDIKYWGLTVQNEPSAGLIRSYRCDMNLCQTLKDFIKYHLGPKLKNSNVGKNIALMIMDDQRYNLPKWPLKVLNDTDASEYISGIAVHWYENFFLFPPSLLVETHNNHPNKFLLSTEACNGYLFWDRGPIYGSWIRGEKYAKDILENLQNWVSGWIDWNICLDLHGGPNWAQNFVDSPVLVNKTADEFYKQPMFYVMGHFSKFIRSGSTKVNASFPKGLNGAAFVTPSRQRVLVIVNQSDSKFDDVTIQDSTIAERLLTNVTIDPHSINTIIWDKVKS
uniref:Glucosylceramidase n=1 Tax=Syphacia muris TaxID=451379 RepID=A0A0N5B0T4_9BILA